MTITKQTIGKIALLLGVLFYLSACEFPTETKTQSYNLFNGLEEVAGADNVKLTIKQGSAVGRDAYFEFKIENIQSNLLTPGVYDGWCIEWTKPIAQQGDLHEDLSMYSTNGKEEWKPLNYFLNIMDELKANDPDLDFVEFQAVIWSVQVGPAFDVNKLEDHELPPRLLKDGKANFSREKVNAIVEQIRINVEDFEYGADIKYALFLKTDEGEQDVMVPVDPPGDGEDNDGEDSDELIITSIDLGSLVDFGHTSAMAINNEGQITGQSNGLTDNFDNNIFIWEEASGMEAIPEHPDAATFHLDDEGNDINNDAQIVGRQWPVAVKWNPEDGIFAFTEGIPVALHSHGVGTGINDNGVASGYRYGVSSTLNSYAVRWDADNSEHRLPSFSEALFDSTGSSARSFDINIHGQIVGYSEYPGEDRRAALWNGDNIMKLGDLGYASEANAINDLGQVVGFVRLNEDFNSNRAFYWDASSGMTFIEGLEDHESVATDINDLGQIVGYIDNYNGYSRVAFYWDEKNGVIVLPPYEDDVASLANGLNENGQIVGSSSIANTSTSKAVRWTISIK